MLALVFTSTLTVKITIKVQDRLKFRVQIAIFTIRCSMKREKVTLNHTYHMIFQIKKQNMLVKTRSGWIISNILIHYTIHHHYY